MVGDQTTGRLYLTQGCLVRYLDIEQPLDGLLFFSRGFEQIDPDRIWRKLPLSVRLIIWIAVVDLQQVSILMRGLFNDFAFSGLRGVWSTAAAVIVGSCGGRC